MVTSSGSRAPGAPLDPDLESLRATVRLSGRAPMVELTPTEARERVAAGDRLCSAGPAVPTRDWAPSPGGPPVPVRVYEPAACRGTLVYAHGGGWVTGDLAYSDELCRFLAVEASVRVVSVDYRLAPEHPFPAGLEDLEGAWDWTVGMYADRPVALGGDSAGGNLAAALTDRLVERGEAPAAQLLIYPVLGALDATASYERCATAFPIGRADMRWFWGHYVGHLIDELHLVSEPDLVPRSAPVRPGTPPTHLVLAGHDPLHDEGAEHARQLRAGGVTVTVADHADLCHGFLRFTAVCGAARRAQADLVRAVEHLWPGPVAAGPRQNGAYDRTHVEAGRVSPPTIEEP